MGDYLLGNYGNGIGVKNYIGSNCFVKNGLESEIKILNIFILWF